MPTTITATEAAKRLSAVLDELAYGHEDVYYVERHGKRVARIEADPEGPRGARWGDVVELLRSAPRPDPDFAADIEAAKAEFPPERDPWEHS